MTKPTPCLIAACAILLLTSGCATITRGTSEQLMVQSTPSGASVRLSNGFTGLTPATFTVPRKGDIVVTVTKEEFESQEITLRSGLAGKGAMGFAGNVLIGGLIGGGIDIASGATLSHTPNPLQVTLVAKPKPKPAETPPAPLPPAPAVAPAPVPEALPPAEKLAVAPKPPEEVSSSVPASNPTPTKNE